MRAERVSVIVRAKDEAGAIGRTMKLLQEQSRVPDEIIVVDSGSCDSTAQIAEAFRARVISIPAWSFTFGGALNRGCVDAHGDVLVALSAHAFPTRRDWLEQLIAYFEDDRVACVTGCKTDPRGEPLTRVIRQDLEHVLRHPHWGYSNGAGAFRADLWRERPFRVDMPGTEDKEWAWHWLHAGRISVVDPGLTVEHDHSRDPLHDLYRRSRVEWAGLAMFLPLGAVGARDLVREWWTDSDDYASRWRARLSPKRMASLAGKFRGCRLGAERSRPPRPRLSGPLKLVITTDQYPALSETFVTSEVGALQALGHTVAVEATDLPRRPNWSDAPQAAVWFIEDDRRVTKLRALAWLVMRHPFRLASDLVMRRQWQTNEAVRPARALAARARRWQRSNVDHVHVHFASGAALDAKRVADWIGIPYSVTAHAYEIFASPANLRSKLEGAAFVTSGCEYNVHHLRCCVSSAHAPRVHKMVMGVDGTSFRRATAHPVGRRVLAVGRLVEKKGFADLIDAVALLEASSPIDRLTIIGDGPLHDRLAEHTKRLGLEHRVTLEGAQAPTVIRQQLETADLLAMPCVVADDGDRDSMPVVVKEAMAMEVPVVVTREVGLPELVGPEHGRLVPPRDPVALAAAIGEILGLSAEERAEFGRRGRERVLADCDVGRETQRLVNLVRTVH